LLKEGYIKIDDDRRFHRDNHYYATIDEIASVEAGTIRLSKARDELFIPID